MINCRVVCPSPGPKLQLENLQSLQRLALKRIVPAKLQVRETCSVSFEGSQLSRMSDQVWSDMAASISYVRIEDTSSTLLDVPASFAGFTNLQDVYRSLKGLGQDGAHVSLQNGVANVRRLCIISDKDMFVTVPANVRWEEV